MFVNNLAYLSTKHCFLLRPSMMKTHNYNGISLYNSNIQGTKRKVQLTENTEIRIIYKHPGTSTPAELVKDSTKGIILLLGLTH